MVLDITRTLTKHIAAIHNSAALNSTQRKVMNIFLENALRDDFESKVHKISLSSLMRDLGWSSSSKITELLKTDLKELAKIQIEWNVLNADRKNKWVAMQLLAEVGLENGEVTYAYPPTLKELLFNPNIYAKLDLDTQKLLGTRYSVALWELLSGEFSIKQQTSVSTAWIKYQDLLKIFGLSNSVYESRYADFINKVLEPAIKDVTLKSHFNLSYEISREGRKIAYISFNAHKKEDTIETIGEVTPIRDFGAETLKARLERLGFSTRFINTITVKYTIDEIKDAIDACESSLKSGKIKCPVAYLKKALEEGWVLPEVVQRRIAKDNEEIKSGLASEIDNLNEPEIIKSLRLCLMKRIGEAPYQGWVHKARFEVVKDTLCVFAPSRFQMDWIENNYKHEIHGACRELKEIAITHVHFGILQPEPL